MKRKQLLLATTLTLILSACGGSEDTQPVATPDIINNPKDNVPNPLAPIIQITDVKEGLISGLLYSSKSSSIIINNQEVQAIDPGGDEQREHSFSIAGIVPDFNKLYTIQAKDIENNFSPLFTYAEQTKNFNSAITMRVQNKGLNLLTKRIEENIENVNLRSNLIGLANNGTDAVVSINVPSFGTYNFFVTDDTDDYNIGETTIKLTPLATQDDKARFNIAMSIKDIKLRFIADEEVLSQKIDLSPTIEEANFTGTIVVDANGVLNVNSENLSLVLVNYENNIAGNAFLKTIVEPAASGAEAIIHDALLVKLNEFINIDMQRLASQIPFSSNNVALNGKSLSISQPANFVTTDAQGMTIKLDSLIQTNSIDVNLPGALGSTYIDTELPVIITADSDFDISTSISVNVLNQALLAAYQSGATNFDGQNDNYNFTIIPQQAAIIKLESAQGNLGEFGLKYFKVQIKENENILANIEANLNISLTKNNIDIANGNLLVNLEQELINVDLTRIEFTDQLPTNKSNKAYLENYVKEILPDMIPSLTLALNRIPVPKLAGYSINLNEKFATAATKGHLALAGDMVTQKNTIVAPEPNTYVRVETGIKGASRANTQIQSDLPITLILSGENPTNEPLKYSYKVDNKKWSIWTVDKSVQLHNLKTGIHTAIVCSRTSQMKVDSSCAEISFYK